MGEQKITTLFSKAKEIDTNCCFSSLKIEQLCLAHILYILFLLRQLFVPSSSGLIPMLFGLCLELIIVVPFRVPLHHTPVLWIWHIWALGVLYTKIAAALTMMGPEWRLKRSIEALFRAGFRELSLRTLLTDLAIPVILTLSLVLSVPYITAYSIVPIFVRDKTIRNLVARRIYPSLLAVGVAGSVVYVQIGQFIQLCEHIKNDKYLIGRTLVNYNSRRNAPSEVN